MPLPDFNTQDTSTVTAGAGVAMAVEIDKAEDELREINHVLTSMFVAIDNMAKVDQSILKAVEGLLAIENDRWADENLGRGLALESQREAAAPQETVTGDNGGLLMDALNKMKSEASTIALILGALAAAFVAFSDNIPMWMRKLMGYQEGLQENRERVTKELEQTIEENKDASTRLGEGQKARAERALEIMKDNPKVTGTGAKALAADEAGGFKGTGEFSEDDVDTQTFEANKQIQAKEKVIELSKDIYYLKNVATEEEDPEAYGMNSFIAERKLEEAVDISRKNGLAMSAEEILKIGMPASAQNNITNNSTQTLKTDQIIKQFYNDEDKVMNQGELKSTPITPTTRTVDVTSDEAWGREEKSFADRFGGSEEMSDVLKKIDVKPTISGDNQGIVIPITYKSQEQQSGKQATVVNNVDNSTTNNVMNGGSSGGAGRSVPSSAKQTKTPGSSGSTELTDWVNGQ